MVAGVVGDVKTQRKRVMPEQHPAVEKFVEKHSKTKSEKIKSPPSSKSGDSPVLKPLSPPAHGVLEDVVNLAPFDAFADAEGADDNAKGGVGYVHLRVQQRNGRKSLTTIEGLPKGADHEKVLRRLRKRLCCNGNLVEDPIAGCVLQLQGDQRKAVYQYLTEAGVVPADHLKMHGF
eukprot:jgi/Chlat1/986/Chrsp108S01403